MVGKTGHDLEHAPTGPLRLTNARQLFIALGL